MVQALPTSVAPFLAPPAHLTALPHLVLEPELAPRNVGWPSVSAGPGATQVTAVRGRKVNRSPAVALLDAMDQVLSARDPHVVFRIAVEVSHRLLGLRHPALLLVDRSSQSLCGTWRAKRDGELEDERRLHVKLSERHREAEARARDHVASFTVCAEEGIVRPATTLYPDAQLRTVLTPIIGRDRLIGFLENVVDHADDAVCEATQTRVAILSRALAGLLDDIERHAQSLPWEPLLTRRPTVPSSAHESLVAAVLRALVDDASVSSGTLARQLRVSTSQLSTVFRDQTGISLTQYRNRLRIERFFTEVEPTGGNLLQAAFHAGFGSYPQFHRVFRELLDATPRDYLSAPETFMARASGRAQSSVVQVPAHDTEEAIEGLLATG